MQGQIGLLAQLLEQMADVSYLGWRVLAYVEPADVGPVRAPKHGGEVVVPGVALALIKDVGGREVLAQRLHIELEPVLIALHQAEHPRGDGRIYPVGQLPWGNPETSGGLTATTPFGFAGGYTDVTGALYLISRYYDPGVGTFISVDPLLQVSTQPYLYAGDNPVNQVDPLGQLHCRPKHLISFAPSVYCYLSGRATGDIAHLGKAYWASIVALIAAFIKKYIPEPLDDLLIEKIIKAVDDAVDEARSIVGGESDEAVGRYLKNPHKSCMYSDAYVHILLAKAYIRFGKYYKKPKRKWCTG